jgi:apolipoprotein D and lipocalin family protein
LKTTTLASAVIAALLALVSCASGSRAVRESGPLGTVERIDIPRYMGRWYVIANIPTFIEKGAHNAVELYAWNAEKDRIDIDFRFNKGSFDGKLKIYPQKAWIHDTRTNAEWRIQPVWPLKFAYLVLDLGEDYEYTVIGVPNRKYIWIMAREPEMDGALYSALVEKARTQWGYDAGAIQKVPQKR